MSGRLGAADLAAGVNTGLYTMAADGTVNISICNRNNTKVAAIRVAIVDGAVGALADDDYIAFDRAIQPNGQYEHTGIACSAGETIVVRSNEAGVSVRVHGFND